MPDPSCPSVRPLRRGRLVRVLPALLASLVGALALSAGPADAAAYRYWGYFHEAGGDWAFSSKGPAQTTPADGSVEGWRFAVGTSGSSRTPRVDVSFRDLCGSTKAAPGQKRVGVVLDFGRPADTADGSTPPKPVGRCASVDDAASGAEVLGAVAEVRIEKSLVCGVDGFPATGCGEAVPHVSAAAKAPDHPVELARPAESAATSEQADDGSDVGTYAGIGVVALAAGGLGVAAARRRSRADAA